VTRLPIRRTVLAVTAASIALLALGWHLSKEPS
jgi:hypothetical protein